MEFIRSIEYNQLIGVLPLFGRPSCAIHPPIGRASRARRGEGVATPVLRRAHVDLCVALPRDDKFEFRPAIALELEVNLDDTDALLQLGDVPQSDRSVPTTERGSTGDAC